MPTDLEIARAATMRPIVDVAAELGLTDDDLELYGRYKAKVKLSALEERRDKLSDKLVLVSAITPTPAGEGKTTTSIGLAMGLAKIGERACLALREPSLGPALGTTDSASPAGWRTRPTARATGSTCTRPPPNRPDTSRCFPTLQPTSRGPAAQGCGIRCPLPVDPNPVEPHRVLPRGGVRGYVHGPGDLRRVCPSSRRDRSAGND